MSLLQYSLCVGRYLEMADSLLRRLPSWPNPASAKLKEQLSYCQCCRNPQVAWPPRRECSRIDEVCSDLHQITPTPFHKGTSAEGTTGAPLSFTFPSLPRPHNLSLEQLRRPSQQAHTGRFTTTDFPCFLKTQRTQTH